MKFAADRPYSDPDVAAREPLEIANAVEAAQNGRIDIEPVNRPFPDAGAAPAQFRAALARTVKKSGDPRC
jgi:hypothetical protein